MRYLIFVLFCCSILFCKAQDTVFLAKCKATVTGDKYEIDNYTLTHTILQVADTMVLVQEFFNNSRKPVFITPYTNTISGGCNFAIDEEEYICYKHIIEFVFIAEINNNIFDALLLLPGKKIKRYYSFEPKELLDNFSNYKYVEGVVVDEVGANFSFFEYPLHIPIHTFINKPYMRGTLNRWHQNIKGINMQYISLFCTIPEK